MVTFILFLIPGTLKDMLTYIVGVTDMSVWKFIGISTFARIPSVLLQWDLGKKPQLQIVMNGDENKITIGI